jgi:hypothetical protein
MALETGDSILQRFNQLHAARSNYESTWQDISDDILGLRTFNEKRDKGVNRHRRIYDTTGMNAGYLLASMLNGWITNPGAPFHQAIVPKGAREIGQNNDYLVHLDEVLDKLYKDERFGFPTAATEYWIDYVFFGTAGMFTDDQAGFGPVDFARPLGELVIDEGSDGRIDTVYRMFPMSSRAFVQEFGRDAHPATTAMLDSNAATELELIHLTHPRSDITFGPQMKGMKFRSVHIVRSDGTVIREKGQTSDPWQVARWGKEAGEMYGRGPGWQALPDCQTANEMKRIMLELGQKDLDPPLLVPDDGILTQIDTSPRGLVVYRAGAFDRDGIRKFPTGEASPITVEVVQSVQHQIQQRFYAHLLQLFDSGVATATQALEMESKAARILVSVVSRAAAEFASKSLRRKFDVAQRNGMFDAPPESMVGIPVQIQYLSPIMKAQRQMQTRATLNTYAAAQQMAQASGDISVFDNFRDDDSIREIAAAEGMNLGNLESVEIRDAMREIRARQEQQQQQLDQLSQGADAVGKALPALAKAQQDRGAPQAA